MKTPDPKLRQELLNTKYKPYEDAFNQNDAAAVAALYTEDAVLLPPETDTVYGREAIEKYFADLFTQYHASNCVIRPDQYSPHSIGTTGNERYNRGEWSATAQGQTGNPVQLRQGFSDRFSAGAALLRDSPDAGARLPPTRA